MQNFGLGLSVRKPFFCPRKKSLFEILNKIQTILCLTAYSEKLSLHVRIIQTLYVRSHIFAVFFM